MLSDEKIREIVEKTRQQFRSFGGGRTDYSNPLSIAFADTPPTFAGGVNIEEVVRFVVSKAGPQG